MTKDNDTYNDDESVYDSQSDSVYDDSLSQNYDQEYEGAYDDTPVDDQNTIGDDWQNDDANAVTDLSAPEEKKSLIENKPKLVKILGIGAAVVVAFFGYLVMSGDESNVVDADSATITSTPASGDTAPPAAVSVIDTEMPSDLVALQAMPPLVPDAGNNNKKEVANDAVGLMTNPELLGEMENLQGLPPQATVSPEISEEKPNQSAKSDAEKSVGETFALNPDSVRPLDNMAAIDSTPADLSDVTVGSVQPDGNNLMVERAGILPSVAVVSDFPTVDSIRKQATQADSLPKQDNTMPAISGEKLGDVKVSDKSETVNESLDLANESQQGKNDKLSDLKSSDNSSFQNKIAELEKKLAEKDRLLNEKISEKDQGPSFSDEVNRLKSRIAELESQIDKPKDSLPKAQVVTQAKKQTTQSRQVTGRTHQWVLKSVKSGSGAVLVDSRTRDLKSVRVGDTLSGIGRITFIGDDRGRWVVKGTKGTVSQ